MRNEFDHVGKVCRAAAILSRESGDETSAAMFDQLERMAFCLYNVSRCSAAKADDKHSEECEQLWNQRKAHRQ